MSKNQSTRDTTKEMTEYVFYIRTKEGAKERKNFPIFLCYESLVPYVHEEVLVGWPEDKVFWAKEEGPSVGMAPYRFRSHRATDGKDS